MSSPPQFYDRSKSIGYRLDGLCHSFLRFAKREKTARHGLMEQLHAQSARIRVLEALLGVQPFAEPEQSVLGDWDD